MAEHILFCSSCKQKYNFFENTWANIGDEIKCSNCNNWLSGIKEPAVAKLKYQYTEV